MPNTRSQVSLHPAASLLRLWGRRMQPALFSRPYPIAREVLGRAARVFWQASRRPSASAFYGFGFAPSGSTTVPSQSGKANLRASRLVPFHLSPQFYNKEGSGASVEVSIALVVNHLEVLLLLLSHSVVRAFEHSSIPVSTSMRTCHLQEPLSFTISFVVGRHAWDQRLQPP